jgi:hypothetical protein
MRRRDFIAGLGSAAAMDKGAIMLRSVTICLLVLLAIPANASAQGCVGNPVAVQILGSGAPPINPNRALTNCLLWVGAQAKILVDAGCGTSIRFGQSQAN